MKKYKTLEEVAVKFKVTAQSLMSNNTYYKNPIDTGNLIRNIGSYNTVNRMIKVQTETQDVIVLTYGIDGYAPNGAYYGQYVHNGTWKMIKRPFAKDAAYNSSMVSFINTYLNDKFNAYSDNVISSLDESLTKLTKV